MKSFMLRDLADTEPTVRVGGCVLPDFENSRVSGVASASQPRYRKTFIAA